MFSGFHEAEEIREVHDARHVRVGELNLAHDSIFIGHAGHRAATNGEPSRLMSSAAIMYQLKYQAIELMKIPTGDGDRTAGPSFEYFPGRISID